MKLILSYTVLLVAVLYWLCTFGFNVPDNYINLSLINQSHKFNSFFYQNWSFFAPPPKANNKIYIIFYSKKDTGQISFEILQSLHKAKQNKVPFNWNEDILDYVISNSAINISAQLAEMNDIKKYLENAETSVSDSITLDKTKEHIQKSYSFVTLLNYSKVVASENSINPADYYLQIKLTSQDIPKFSDRLEVPVSPREQMYFQSDKLTFRK